MNNGQRILFCCLLLCGVCLIPLQCLAKGWITADVSVCGANIMIDEQDGIHIPVNHIKVSVESGLHVVMIDKDGYHPYIDTITIQDGVEHRLQIWLTAANLQTIKKTSRFHQNVWDYKLENGFNKIRWAGIGTGLCTGFEFHISLIDMRLGLLQVEPCVWGINVPFYNLSHTGTTWLVRPQDRRAETTGYEVAIPSADHQFYYTPLVGVYLPFCSQAAITLSAGPQLSWTRTVWSLQNRELITTSDFRYTTEPFPSSGYQFDPVWFSAQIGLYISGYRSDFLTYFKYQDGYFIGLEFRF